jgi:hypothetical protein
MSQEKYDYFVSYVINNDNNHFKNTCITRDKFIESIDEIREIQEYIADQLELNKGLVITIINYRIF